MPAALSGYLIDLIITLAIRFGLPWVIINCVKIPWIGPILARVLTPEVIKIIEDFLESLKQVHGEIRAVKKVAVAKKAGARKKALIALKSIGASPA